MKILVIDGQGGGVGKALISRLRERLPKTEIIALGTNSLATAGMLKAGASVGATGENAICYNCNILTEEDIITGPMGIILANAMLGELSPKMAEAIGSSLGKKILLPVSKCKVQIVGISSFSMEDLLALAVNEIFADISAQNVQEEA